MWINRNFYKTKFIYNNAHALKYLLAQNVVDPPTKEKNAPFSDKTVFSNAKIVLGVLIVRLIKVKIILLCLM